MLRAIRHVVRRFTTTPCPPASRHRRATAIASALLLLAVGAPLRAEYVDTLVNTGNTTTNGQNLRNAVAAAANRAGETRIVLPAGVYFDLPSDSCYLPNKTIDNAYITIESSNMSSLPTAGTRVSPSDAADMPKIRAMRSGIPIFRTNPGAHHYRLRGLEITAGPGYLFSEFVKFGESSSVQDAFAEQPHHIDVDRCYVHPDAANPGPIIHCFSVHSAWTTIANCYVEGVKSSSEPQAIWTCNGTGPYFFVNNYLEASGENFMSGGGGTFLPNATIPSDTTFKRNHCPKPLAWRALGSAISVKNNFEIKFGRRFDIQGNVFENMWVGQQDAVINIKVTGNGDSSNPMLETVTEDVLFQNNKIAHGPTGLVLLGRDGGSATPQMRRVRILNNLWEDLSGTNWGIMNGYSGSFCFLTDGTSDTTIEHNTAYNELYGCAIEDNTWPHSGLIFRNNAIQGSAASPSRVFRNGFGYESAAINWATTSPAAIVTHNLLKGGTQSLFVAPHLPQYFVSSWSGVIDANHNVNASYVGSDGKTVGANMTVLNAATAGSTTGAWAANDIVLYPADAPVKVDWQATNDATAAGGSYLGQSHSTQAKINTASASPASYFEMTFHATAGVPYHLWVRGRALNNDWQNDSAYVQFNQSVNASGAAQWRIGTTSATIAFLEEGSGAGLSGWGWNDNHYSAVSTDSVYFAQSGQQTIRVQQREDGFQIDQIVLSPCTYLSDGPINASPGTLKDDTTILLKTAVPTTQVVLKNGVNGYTGATSFHTDGQYPTSHFGPARYYHSSDNLAATNSYMIRSFYKFDVSPAASGIPAGATIDSARLKIKVDYVSTTSNYGISLYRVAPVGNAFTVNYAAATRNTYNGTNPWTGGQNAGGNVADSNNDFIDTPVANLAIPAAGQWLDFDVTAAVQAWVSGTPNNGLIVRPNDGPNGVTIRLSTPQDSSGSAEYPTLEVTYH